MTQWHEEGDEPRFFTDPATNIPCAMLRNPGGAWCGYAGIPQDHPLHGKDYSDTVQLTEEFFSTERRMGEDYSPISVLWADVEGLKEHRLSLDLALRCHGGVTWAGKLPQYHEEHGQDLWWFGFDCAHSGDLSPKYDGTSFAYGVYRTETYVRGSLAKLCGDIQRLAVDMKESP